MSENTTSQHSHIVVLFDLHEAKNRLIFLQMTNFSREQVAEIEMLIRFNLETTQQGIKVHSNAAQEQIDAIERLYEKGLVTQRDGGYLTDLGRTAAEHAQALLLIMAPHNKNSAS